MADLVIDGEVGEKARPVGVREFDEPKFCWECGLRNDGLYEARLLLDVGVGPLEIHELRGKEDDDLRIAHPLDALELLGSKLYERRRNGQRVCIGRRFDQYVEQLQIVL